MPVLWYARDMPTDLERLRNLVGLRKRRPHSEPEITPGIEPVKPHAPARGDAEPEPAPINAGYEITTAAGACYVDLNAYPLDLLRGPAQLGELLEQAPGIFAPYHPAFRVHGLTDYRRAVFLDTETTGLGNGAGVYCFMVGVGTFETWPPASHQLGSDPTLPGDPADAAPTHFVVRQYFMRNPAEERALLIALADQLASYELTVTFNGRTFDLPLLRGRYQYNRRLLPDLRARIALLGEDRPHLDLLHPARKLWRRRLQSCRLINLEAQILGLQRSEDDVPGYEIPLVYEHFVRTGDASAIRRVFYHNAEDIVSMVALADQLGRAFGNGPPAQAQRAATAAPALHGLDWVGLAVAYEQAGELEQAEAAYRSALDHVRNASHRADLFRRLADLLKRQERWSEAADTWQTWLTSVPGSDPTPYVELAKYCEWHLRDLEQAEMWSAWALHNLRSAHPSARRPADQDALTHRLARIQRKRGAPA